MSETISEENVAEEIIPEELSTLPTVAEKMFMDALINLEYSKLDLISQKNECLALTITDKESAKNVEAFRKHQKAKRITLQKRAKALREPYIQAQDKIIELEKEFVAIISEGEDYLSGIEKSWKEKEAAEKKEREQRQQKIYTKRIQELTLMGVMAEGSRFFLGDLSLDEDLVKSSDESDYQELIYRPFKDIFDANETERLQKEKDEQDRQEELRQQQLKFEQEQKEFEEKQKKFKEEQREMLAQRSKFRTAVVLGIGLQPHPPSQNKAFFFEDVFITETEIETLEEIDWINLIKNTTTKVSDRKAEIEKQIKEKEAAEELHKKRIDLITEIGYNVTEGGVIYGYGSTKAIDGISLGCSEEAFQALLIKLEERKADFIKAEEEREAKKQLIESRKKKITDLGYAVQESINITDACEVIGYNESFGISDISGYNETAFESLLNKLVKNKATYEEAEKERLKKEAKEELERENELKRLKKEAELAEASDQEKWAAFKVEAGLFLLKIPKELKSARYRKAAEMCREKVGEMLDINPKTFYR